MNPITQRQIVTACRNLESSVNDTKFFIKFFDWYYAHFFVTFGVEHKHLTTRSIESVIERLYVFMNDVGFTDMQTLQTLAEKYFQTKFKNCDYSISHFANPEIIMNRYFETLY